MNLRSALLWTVNTVESLAIATVGACVLVKGFILEEPEKHATRKARAANESDRMKWS
jgi:hypothetical protein